MPKLKPALLRERDITRHVARESNKEFAQLIKSDVETVRPRHSGLQLSHRLAT